MEGGEFSPITMLPIVQDFQVGLLIIGIIGLGLVYFKYSSSRIPRLRIIFLSIICLLIWLSGFSLSLVENSPSQTLLWEMLSFLGMAATVFLLFIAFYEILSSPGR